MHSGISVELRNGSGERNTFWTDLNAVLCVTTTADSFVGCEELVSLGVESGSDWVEAEEEGLTEGGWTHKRRFFVDLRAGFHAATAGHTP